MRMEDRIVITGVGLTAPIGNNLADFRESLLNCRSGVRKYETRFIGEVLAGVCDYEPTLYQTRKDIRRGTRAGSISIYCAHEAIKDSGLPFEDFDKSRMGVYLGITEHGNVETENEIYNISQYGYDVKYWSHHHNPRTIANNPAGEVTLNLGITGPHYTLGAACAAGNIGFIQGAQMLRLGEVDAALAGGVSESIHTFGIFASFKSQGALASHEDPAKASRPFDTGRTGIVVSEGGCIYILERLDDALKRGAKVYGELVGYCINSDACDFVLPAPERQAECMRKALKMAGIKPDDIDILNAHATATHMGDIQECKALREVFCGCKDVYINNTKSYIGHAMGAAGALELAGNLPGFDDGIVHPTINLDNLDKECKLDNIVANKPLQINEIKYILNNSFGMFGINSVVIIKKYDE